MQCTGVGLDLCLALLVHKSANINQKDVTASTIYREYSSFEKSRGRGGMQCMLPNYCAKVVSHVSLSMLVL